MAGGLTMQPTLPSGMLWLGRLTSPPKSMTPRKPIGATAMPDTATACSISATPTMIPVGQASMKTPVPGFQQAKVGADRIEVGERRRPPRWAAVRRWANQ
jgi:hypothetical protein